MAGNIPRPTVLKRAGGFAQPTPRASAEFSSRARLTAAPQILHFQSQGVADAEPRPALPRRANPGAKGSRLLRTIGDVPSGRAARERGSGARDVEATMTVH